MNARRVWGVPRRFTAAQNPCLAYPPSKGRNPCKKSPCRLRGGNGSTLKTAYRVPRLTRRIPNGVNDFFRVKYSRLLRLFSFKAGALTVEMVSSSRINFPMRGGMVKPRKTCKRENSAKGDYKNNHAIYLFRLSPKRGGGMVYAAGYNPATAGGTVKRAVCSIPARRIPAKAGSKKQSLFGGKDNEKEHNKQRNNGNGI